MRMKDLPDRRDTPESQVSEQAMLENAAPKVPGIDGIARDRTKNNDGLDMSEKSRKLFNVGPDRVMKLLRGPGWTGPKTGDDIREFLDNYDSAEILTNPKTGDFVGIQDAIYGTIHADEQAQIEARLNQEAADWIKTQEMNADESHHHTVEGDEFDMGDQKSLLRVREQNRSMIANMLLNSPTAGKDLLEATKFYTPEQIAEQEYFARMGGRVPNGPNTIANEVDRVIEEGKAVQKGRSSSKAIGAGFDKQGRIVRQ